MEQPESSEKSAPVQQNKSPGEKAITIFIALTVVVALGALIYTAKSVFFPEKAILSGSENTITAITGAAAETGHSRKGLSLTGYDRALAKQFMDKDNDGQCDSCGMPVDMCIDTGQLQCNMDSTSTIGVLDSAHIHADWRIYVNGKALDLSPYVHMERMRANLPVSSFIHVDSGAPAPEKTGDIVHRHATGVPLWIWFESVGMKLDNKCLVLENGEKYCSNSKNSLKFYVNGGKNEQYEQYVFADLDKILISYGAKGEDVKPQLAAITSFAGKH